MRYVFGFGVQGGGTTIISSMWFRRPDTDGVLDVRNRKLPKLWMRKPHMPREIGLFHQKCTFNHYRTITAPAICDMAKIGFATQDVQWYLIIRNPFLSLNSLKDKPWFSKWERKFKKYGKHYRLAKRRGIPIIKYEDFVINPQREMDRLWISLGLNPCKIDFKKPLRRKKFFVVPPTGNDTFLANQNRVVDTTRKVTLSEKQVSTVSTLCRDLIKDHYENWQETVLPIV